jgi:polysaccharide export outer membrane protein
MKKIQWSKPWVEVFIIIISFIPNSVLADTSLKEVSKQQEHKMMQITEEESKFMQRSEDEYPVGIDDVLEISVIQPDKMNYTVRVSPDGFISFPFIGNVKVKGLTLSQVQEKIRTELENGFLRYPLVYVSLVESRSRRFFVYGEVEKPGTFPLEENTTILRAISMAGGLTKFGSASVKLLSPRESNEGYELTRVNLNKILDGDPQADIVIKPGDVLVVAGGMF